MKNCFILVFLLNWHYIALHTIKLCVFFIASTASYKIISVFQYSIYWFSSEVTFFKEFSVFIIQFLF